MMRSKRPFKPRFGWRRGMIPELPQSYDNAESIYHLLSWLQRMVKRLLDDFTALEAEWDEYKEALKELLENLIPQLIRQFAKSEEFKNIIKDMLKTQEFKDLLKEILKEQQFKDLLKEILQEQQFKDLLKDLLKEVFNDKDMREFFNNYLKEIMSSDDFKDFLNDLIKELDAIKDLIKRLTGLEMTSSIQPPYTRVSIDIRDTVGKGVIDNTAGVQDPHISLMVANLDVQDVGRRYTWLSIESRGYSFNKGAGSTYIGFVPTSRLRAAGLTDSMLDGIRIYNRVFIGVYTQNLNMVQLQLSRPDNGADNDSVLIHMVRIQNDERSTFEPLYYNLTPWLEISNL